MSHQLDQHRKLISICIPVFNERDNIFPFHERILPVLSQLADDYEFELVFTDNHSEDGTFEKLIELSERDDRVRVIRFSRNFGFQRSILANYLQCRGDAAIQIDIDLQDPPELIPDFLQHWRAGYQVVYGVRKRRPNEQWALSATRKIFYRLIDFLSEDYLPHDAGDFRLIDRCIISQLASTSDQQPYLRGMIAAMGFRQIGMVYDRSARERGVSNFNFWRLLNLGIDGILHHSVVPLRLAMVLGIALFVFAIFGTAYFILAKLFFDNDWPTGLATIAVLVLLSMGMNAIFLGILGEYVGRIFKNVKHGPIVIVEAIVDRKMTGGSGNTNHEIASAPLNAGKHR